MTNECARKSCNCEQKCYNSSACSNGCVGFKLFGVQIDVGSDDGGIRKTKSLSNLQACNLEKAVAEPSGYLSDDLVHQSSKSHDRKKGKPWSEEEHRSFLAGLEKLGKGDWKGIANKFVHSRNSSQVASHAQKYFIRMAATEKKRRRASVFDIPFSDVNQSSQMIPGSQQADKPAESSLTASSWASSSKNMTEVKRQVSMPAAIATSERPPLSPMKRHGIPDFHGIVYKPIVSGFTQSFPTQAVMPTVSWVPVVNLSSQSSRVFLPNIHGSLATCPTFVPQPRLQQGSSQAGSAPPTTNNDELNLNIRKLAL